MDMRQLGTVARLFGGVVHGDCQLGTDVEFPNVIKAGEFLSLMNWVDFAIMLTSVPDFTSKVVVTIPNDKVKERDA